VTAAPVINFCYIKSRILFNSFSPRKYTTISSSKREKDIVARVREADGFVEICGIWNRGDWLVEEHVVQTVDGYLLGVHRLRKKDGEDDRRDKAGGVGRGNGGRKVVYLHHGEQVSKLAIAVKDMVVDTLECRTSHE
jgi:lysosomal acid lipase/cholesteryl ester hydrolase